MNMQAEIYITPPPRCRDGTMDRMINTIEFGDCREIMRRWAEQGVKAQMCVTSPPYFGLRSYLPDDSQDKSMEIGLEETPDQYVERMVEVFRAVRDVLADDGTLWLNIGDSYTSGGRKVRAPDAKHDGARAMDSRAPTTDGLKPKDIVGIPWRVAFALQADGWLLRSDIVWSKPNCMPESVKDRPTKAHEYVFLLSKQGRYYYDADAIKEPAVNGEKYHGGQNDASVLSRTRHRNGRSDDGNRTATRNARSVWYIPTSPFSARSVGIDDLDHFAVMPPKLVEPCVLAGCPVGGVVLDPFCGAGTVGLVATQKGRRFIGIDLNARYLEIARRRIEKAAPVLPLLLTGD